MLVITLCAGLLCLLAGGDLLVRSAVRLAEGLKLSPLLIGLTVVAFGTSAPELVTSVEAALLGAPDVALSNVVGSTLINSLVILGLAALIMPLPVERSMVIRDGSWMVGATLLLLVLVRDGTLGRSGGALLLLMLMIYVVLAYRNGSRGKMADRDTVRLQTERRAGSGGVGQALDLMFAQLNWAMATFAFAIGLGLLVLGGFVFVEAAIDSARVLGVSETVVGLTIVAGGTSAPELVTSAIAAYRGRTDVAIGNVLGSNIYNVLGVAGLTGLIAPVAVDGQLVMVDLPLTVAATVLLVLTMASYKLVSRWEGAVLLGAYASFAWFRLI